MTREGVPGSRRTLGADLGSAPLQILPKRAADFLACRASI